LVQDQQVPELSIVILEENPQVLQYTYPQKEEIISFVIVIFQQKLENAEKFYPLMEVRVISSQEIILGNALGGVFLFIGIVGRKEQ
jgi:hypothetical protein